MDEPELEEKRLSDASQFCLWRPSISKDSLQTWPQENLWIPPEVNFLPSHNPCQPQPLELKDYILTINLCLYAVQHISSILIWGQFSEFHSEAFSVTHLLLHQEFQKMQTKEKNSSLSISCHWAAVRLLGARYSTTLASILLPFCGVDPSQRVHECKSPAWIIDGRSDWLHDVVFFHFSLLRIWARATSLEERIWKVCG